MGVYSGGVEVWETGADRPSAGPDADVRIAAWTPPSFLDAAAGLPPSPTAQRWMAEGWRSAWSDPAGRHGWAARSGAVLGESRSRFARFLGCSPAEIWFAPSADVALAGAARALAAADLHGPVLVSPIERLAVLRTIDALPFEYLAVDSAGRVDPSDPLLQQGPGLVILQAANREIGSVQPVDAVAQTLRTGVPLLVDATAIRSPGDLPRDWSAIVLEPAIWGGPSGVSVVGCRSGVPWVPLAPATPADRFPGRLALPLIAAAAMTLPESPCAEREEDRIALLAERFVNRIVQTLGQVDVLGAPEHRLGWIVSLSLLYVNAEQLVDDLSRRGFGVHSGSACTSDTKRPSHVLQAVGALTHGNLRVSIPPGCPPEDLDRLAAALEDLVADQRREAGLG